MRMPKAAVDVDRDPQTRDVDVRLSRKVSTL